MPKPQGFCIYCRGPGLTKEHVWPDWLEPYIPRTLKGYRVNTRIDYFHQEPHVPRPRRREGDPHNSRIRVVCLVCNSGWMSRLQEKKAKPLVVPILHDQPVTLSMSAQTTLAAWIAMSVMVGEFAHTPAVAIPQEDRTHLWRHKKLPSRGWGIWIGRHTDPQLKGRWIHNAIPLFKPEHAPKRGLKGLPSRNTQTTTYVVGPLLIHAISSPVHRVVDLWTFPGHLGDGLIRIWQPTGSVTWPPPATLSDIDADVVAHMFYRETVERGRPFSHLTI